MPNKIEILGCFVDDRDRSGKGVVLAIETRQPIQFVNDGRAELHFEPTLEKIRQMIDVLSAVEKTLLDELPPEQGEYLVFPGGGKPKR